MKKDRKEYFYQITVEVKIPRVLKLSGKWGRENPAKVKCILLIILGVICHRIDPEAGGSLLSIGAFLYMIYGKKKKVSVPEEKEESEDGSEELVMLDDLIDERYREMYEEAFGDAHLEAIYKSLGLEMSQGRKEG